MVGPDPSQADAVLEQPGSTAPPPKVGTKQPTEPDPLTKQDIDDMIADGRESGDGPGGTTYYERGPDGHLRRTSPVDQRVVRQGTGEDMPEAWTSAQGRMVARGNAAWNRDMQIANGIPPAQADKAYDRQMRLINASEPGGIGYHAEKERQEKEDREEANAKNKPDNNSSGTGEANSNKTAATDQSTKGASGAQGPEGTKDANGREGPAVPQPRRIGQSRDPNLKADQAAAGTDVAAPLKDAEYTPAEMNTLKAAKADEKNGKKVADAQEILKNHGENIGEFGQNHDGVDGKAGAHSMTDAALKKVTAHVKVSSAPPV